MTQADDLDYVKLISSEDHVFLVHRNCAMVSGTIRAMLSGVDGGLFGVALSFLSQILLLQSFYCF
jgi:hypothetical protein